MLNGSAIYLMLLLITGVGYFLSSMYSLLIILILLIVLPIISLLISLPGMFKTDIEKTHERFIAKRNRLAPLHFRRVDYKFFPSALIKVKYSYHQENCDHSDKYRAYIVGDKGSIELRRQHVGRIDLTIYKFYCYDLLGVFAKKRKCNKQCSLFIEPNIIDIQKEVKDFEVFVDESETYSPYKHGNDYSEIYDIRKYRHGDVLKHIHWRTSLARQDLYVKVGSQPIQNKVLVRVEITEDLNKNDHAFDRFHSLCYKLIEQDVEYDIIYQSVDMENYLIVNITNSEDYNNTLYNMLAHKLIPNQQLTLEMLNNKYGIMYTATNDSIKEEFSGGLQYGI